MKHIAPTTTAPLPFSKVLALRIRANAYDLFVECFKDYTALYILIVILVLGVVTLFIMSLLLPKTDPQRDLDVMLTGLASLYFAGSVFVLVLDGDAGRNIK